MEKPLFIALICTTSQYQTTSHSIKCTDAVWHWTTQLCSLPTSGAVTSQAFLGLSMGQFYWTGEREQEMWHNFTGCTNNKLNDKVKYLFVICIGTDEHCIGILAVRGDQVSDNTIIYRSRQLSEVEKKISQINCTLDLVWGNITWKECSMF